MERAACVSAPARQRRLALTAALVVLLLSISPTATATATPTTTARNPNAKTCADPDGDGTFFDYCTTTPGYKLKSTPIADPSLLTISNCCERDDTRSSFAACDSPGAGGAGLGGVQAPMEGDSSWIFQDSAAFGREVGSYQGLCFSVVINAGECSSYGPDPLTGPKCCTRRAPSALQLKIATATAPSVASGSRRATTLAQLAKCGLATGSATAVSARGFRRVSRWEKVAPSDHTQFFNVPVSFPARTRQATFCVYSNTAASDASTGLDCSWESICGFKDGSVPFGGVAGGDTDHHNNEYAQGCEVRLVGRRAPSSSQCCTPPMSLVSFDGFESDYDDDGGGGGGSVRVAAAAEVPPAVRTRRAATAAAAARAKRSFSSSSSRAGVAMMRRGN
jgi:hypothetical protein